MAWPVLPPIVIDVTPIGAALIGAILIDAILIGAIRLNSIQLNCIFVAIVRSDRGHGGRHMA
ncbi:MAG TPA: hypothetical protein VHQ21_10295 [Rhodanobacteraceae bacterium]|nr:hypothetical protein [Rhodanobacteraceae bacterium]